VKEVQFLAHEQIIQKFRDHKAFARRLKKARDKRDREKANRILTNKPTYEIDHIVKERYPNFIDALRDLDDGITLCFLFARMPKSRRVDEKLVDMCRRLTAEFQHYCIEEKALRKVFVSIKGIYYQAEIMGQTVTWIVPHDRGHAPAFDVDFAVMATFLEFYVSMLGFVNYKLFQSLGLHYPPQLSPTVSQENSFDKDEMPEKIYSLNQPLLRSEDSAKIDRAQIDEFESTDDAKFEAAKRQQKKIDELKKLFEGCRIFLGRECPRESLAFVIRSCGGEVSWDPTVAYGSTFAGDDPSVTHQIVDRPSIETQDVNRFYLQPQWAYDSVNARMLLPKDDYFPGATLPPHLSPFVEANPGDYVPPEKLKLMQMQGEDTSGFVEPQAELPEGPPTAKKAKKSAAQGVQVTPGRERISKISKQKEELKLQEMMVPKKFRMAYKKMKFGEKRKAKETKKLKEKRKKAEKIV